MQARVQHLPIERHSAAADRTARHVALTELAAANAKSISTAVTISALPRLRALCRTSLFAFGMNTSTSSVPAHLQNKAHAVVSSFLEGPFTFCVQL